MNSFFAPQTVEQAIPGLILLLVVVGSIRYLGSLIARRIWEPENMPRRSLYLYRALFMEIVGSLSKARTSAPAACNQTSHACSCDRWSQDDKK